MMYFRFYYLYLLARELVIALLDVFHVTLEMEFYTVYSWNILKACLSGSFEAKKQNTRY